MRLALALGGGRFHGAGAIGCGLLALLRPERARKQEQRKGEKGPAQRGAGLQPAIEPGRDPPQVEHQQRDGSEGDEADQRRGQ
jgi:hypothetical protein